MINMMHEIEPKMKTASIEWGMLVIAAVTLGFAIAGRFMPCPNAYILLLDAATWFLLIAFGISFLIRNNTKKDLLAVAIAFPIFIVTIFGVMLSDGIACISYELFGTKKAEVIKTLGLGMGGIIAFYGFTILNRRAVAQDEANKLTEKGHIQDRLNAAVEHIGNERSSARMASFYEFLYLAGDVTHYAQSILGILCVHLQNRGSFNNNNPGVNMIEIQALVNILFSSEAKDIFGKFAYDLPSVNLSTINFQKMQKPKRDVDFSGAILSEAVFTDTNLSGFIFREATLCDTQLGGADLQKSILFDADLSGANLSHANLSGADLSDAQLPNANLSGADLSGAKLLVANFSKANLSDANLNKSIWLESAILSGAIYNDRTIFPDEFLIPEDMIKTE